MSDIKKHENRTLTKSNERSTKMADSNSTKNKNNKEEKTRNVLITVLIVAIIALIIILLMRGCNGFYYASFNDGFDKVEKEANQKKIPKDKPVVAMPEEEDDEVEYTNTVMLNYRNYTANLSGDKLYKEVINLNESNQDIVAQFYISGDELKTKLDSQQAKLIKDGETFMIAQSGLVEPGYEVDVLDYIDLPNDIEIPAGSYDCTYKQIYYDHETGQRANIEGTLKLTLNVE